MHRLCSYMSIVCIQKCFQSVFCVGVDVLLYVLGCNRIGSESFECLARPHRTTAGFESGSAGGVGAALGLFIIRAIASSLPGRWHGTCVPDCLEISQTGQQVLGRV